MTGDGPTPAGRLLSADDLILDPASYAAARPALRTRMIAVRGSRRVRLGDIVALAFENADTLRWQVQEMVMVERVSDPGAVEAEVASYARLLPTPDSLVATLFLEHDDRATVKEDLRRLTGIQHGVRLEVGGEPGNDGPAPWVVPGEEIPGEDETGPSEVTHAVHFLRFRLPSAARAAFLDPAVPVVAAVEHDEYAASAPIDGEARLSLMADLADPR